MRCFDKCEKNKEQCQKKDCRLWIDYERDLNCTVVAINNNNGKPLTLRETAERLDISFVRVKQIEDKAVDKLGFSSDDLKIFLEEIDPPH